MTKISTNIVMAKKHDTDNSACILCEKKERISNGSLYLNGRYLCMDYNAYSCDSSFRARELMRMSFCPLCGKSLVGRVKEMASSPQGI